MLCDQDCEIRLRRMIEVARITLIWSQLNEPLRLHLSRRVWKLRLQYEWFPLLRTDRSQHAATISGIAGARLVQA